jgi:predicted nuclease of predicted toxin-antitoxin system
MSKLFADEDVDHRVVLRLRALGHDVVTVMDVHRRGLRDAEQLAFASGSERILLTFNRADFHALHRQGAAHAGIITCTRDPDIEALVRRIHAALLDHVVMAGVLVKVVRENR